MVMAWDQWRLNSKGKPADTGLPENCTLKLCVCG